MTGDLHDRLWRALKADQERARAKLTDPGEIQRRIARGLAAKATAASTFNAGRLERKHGGAPWQSWDED